MLYIIHFQETLKFIGHKLCTVEMFSTTAVTHGTENLLQTFNDFSECHGRQNIHFEMSAVIINLDKYIFSLGQSRVSLETLSAVRALVV